MVWHGNNCWKKTMWMSLLLLQNCGNLMVLYLPHLLNILSDENFVRFSKYYSSYSLDFSNFQLVFLARNTGIVLPLLEFYFLEVAFHVHVCGSCHVTPCFFICVRSTVVSSDMSLLPNVHFYCCFQNFSHVEFCVQFKPLTCVWN